MRLLADARVARSLVAALRSSGHDVVNAAHGPPSVDDAVILQTAHDENRLVLTEDHDFGALAVRDARRSHGVILDQLHGLSALSRDARVIAVLDIGDDLGECFTVIEPSRTRSRPLEPA